MDINQCNIKIENIFNCNIMIINKSINMNIEQSIIDLVNDINTKKQYENHINLYIYKAKIFVLYFVLIHILIFMFNTSLSTLIFNGYTLYLFLTLPTASNDIMCEHVTVYIILNIALLFFGIMITLVSSLTGYNIFTNIVFELCILVYFVQIYTNINFKKQQIYTLNYFLEQNRAWLVNKVSALLISITEHIVDYNESFTLVLMTYKNNSYQYLEYLSDYIRMKLST
jgi:hypothetical protein